MLTVKFVCPVCEHSYQCEHSHDTESSFSSDLCPHTIFVLAETTSWDHQTSYRPNSTSIWLGHSFTDACSDVLEDIRNDWGGKHEALKNQLKSIGLCFIEEGGREGSENNSYEIKVFGLASPQPERIIEAIEKYCE